MRAVFSQVVFVMLGMGSNVLIRGLVVLFLFLWRWIAAAVGLATDAHGSRSFASHRKDFALLGSSTRALLQTNGPTTSLTASPTASTTFSPTSSPTGVPNPTAEQLADAVPSTASPTARGSAKRWYRNYQYVTLVVVAVLAVMIALGVIVTALQADYLKKMRPHDYDEKHLSKAEAEHKFIELIDAVVRVLRKTRREVEKEHQLMSEMEEAALAHGGYRGEDGTVYTADGVPVVDWSTGPVLGGPDNDPPSPAGAQPGMGPLTRSMEDLQMLDLETSPQNTQLQYHLSSSSTNHTGLQVDPSAMTTTNNVNQIKKGVTLDMVAVRKAEATGSKSKELSPRFAQRRERVVHWLKKGKEKRDANLSRNPKAVPSVQSGSKNDEVFSRERQPADNVEKRTIQRGGTGHHHSVSNSLEYHDVPPHNYGSATTNISRNMPLHERYTEVEKKGFFSDAQAYLPSMMRGVFGFNNPSPADQHPKPSVPGISRDGVHRGEAQYSTHSSSAGSYLTESGELTDSTRSTGVTEQL
eukprot:CAMPEP_0114273200 /NCGR_PEP_ID=MMETSP0058-20121206/28964_1 /TAXON_ID=36894 /ORGANISM="Pyramimonas parkeae, CCMP726" /LENGTH=524 /DNA_ID=CAMNT_0001392627 /DNA_START=419 /DNA_END=1993 /DNA_ORIENTATION=-